MVRMGLRRRRSEGRADLRWSERAGASRKGAYQCAPGSRGRDAHLQQPVQSGNLFGHEPDDVKMTQNSYFPTLCVNTPSPCGDSTVLHFVLQCTP